jgi:hypothetical protein
MNYPGRCLTDCFQRVWGRVLAMSAVLFRSVTCLIKIEVSLISEEHDLDLQCDPTFSWTKSNKPMACDRSKVVNEKGTT